MLPELPFGHAALQRDPGVAPLLTCKLLTGRVWGGAFPGARGAQKGRMDQGLLLCWWDME